MLDMGDYIFYVLAALSVISGLGMVLMRNPIYSALWLAVTMITISALFALLDAMFIAGVQLIVYAGAVLVLFVMVLMLFDLKHETKAFSKGTIAGLLKLSTAGFIAGILAFAVWMSVDAPIAETSPQSRAAHLSTKKLGELLFKDYLFAFEAIGVLLLIIAVGAVTLSRISGGTHADS